jgi:hypothetical protein
VAVSSRPGFVGSSLGSSLSSVLSVGSASGKLGFQVSDDSSTVVLLDNWQGNDLLLFNWGLFLFFSDWSLLFFSDWSLLFFSDWSLLFFSDWSLLFFSDWNLFLFLDWLFLDDWFFLDDNDLLFLNWTS